MNRRPLYAGLLAVALAALALLVIRPASPAMAATPVRIMPLGDSITGSPGCWRALLWNRLQSNGFTNIDFVGTLPPQGCGVTYDGDNEGHGGYLATNIANQNMLPGWLSATLPDVVIMHLGTNDVWSNIAPATILAAFTTLHNQMRASNPNIKLLVAKIIPMNPSSCAECGQRVIEFNNAIPAWANSRSTTQSPVIVVDQWTGFSTASDTGDGVHPNATGDQKMSDRWYPTLVPVLSGITPSNPVSPSASVSRSASASASASRSASASASASRSSGPPPTGGCSATYRVVGQWQGGFQGEVQVTNTGTAAIGSWTVRFTFGAGQVISQAWVAKVSQSGANVTALNESWNGNLGASASTTFGFIASWTGSNPTPTATCVAG